MPAIDALDEVGFGGGCHWCTEAVFASLIGVSNVRQGFVRSKAPNDAWSEAVLLAFDGDQVSLQGLIDVHLKTHAAYAEHSMRGKYRSAVYTTSSNQHTFVDTYLKGLNPKPVTRALPLIEFKPSDERFHNYYETDSERPFCKIYIEPKLEKLRETPKLLIPERR